MNPNSQQLPQYIEGLSYPDEVKDAVRYGYQYRVESVQRSQKEDSHFNRRIGATPEIILWFASLVFDGVAWDVLKLIAETILKGFKDSKKQMPREAMKLLSNETDFRTFYEYVVEYKEHRMTVSDKETKYIVEEIVADYSGKEAAEAFIQEHLIKVLEHKTLFFDAKTRLQEIIQKDPGARLTYELLSEEGPSHNKLFTSAVLLNGREIGRGSGHSKKLSQQEAAVHAMETITQEEI